MVATSTCLQPVVNTLYMCVTTRLQRVVNMWSVFVGFVILADKDDKEVVSNVARINRPSTRPSRTQPIR